MSLSRILASVKVKDVISASPLMEDPDVLKDLRTSSSSYQCSSRLSSILSSIKQQSQSSTTKMMKPRDESNSEDEDRSDDGNPRDLGSSDTSDSSNASDSDDDVDSLLTAAKDASSDDEGIFIRLFLFIISPSLPNNLYFPPN